MLHKRMKSLIQLFLNEFFFAFFFVFQRREKAFFALLISKLPDTNGNSVVNQMYKWSDK